MQSTILLTEREVAQCLRLGANTLAEWRIRGEEPRFIKIGARIRYDEREVADWVASCRRASTSEQGEAAWMTHKKKYPAGANRRGASEGQFAPLLKRQSSPPSSSVRALSRSPPRAHAVFGAGRRVSRFQRGGKMSGRGLSQASKRIIEAAYQVLETEKPRKCQSRWLSPVHAWRHRVEEEDRNRQGFEAARLCARK